MHSDERKERFYMNVTQLLLNTITQFIKIEFFTDHFWFIDSWMIKCVFEIPKLHSDNIKQMNRTTHCFAYASIHRFTFDQFHKTKITTDKQKMFSFFLFRKVPRELETLNLSQSCRVFFSLCVDILPFNISVRKIKILPFNKSHRK